MNLEHCPTITLSPGRIEDCCAKDDEPRYYLKWPYLDLSGKKPLLVATNGAILAAITVRIDGEVSEGPLPVEALKAARREVSGTSENPKLLVFDKEWVGTEKALFRRPGMDGKYKFPDWRRVVPEVEADQQPDIGFDAEYLARCQRALGNGDKYHTARFYLQKNDIKGAKAALVRPMSNDFDAFCVIMPMRV